MPLPILRGRIALAYGDDFDVDQIVGVANIKVHNIAQLAQLALDNAGPASAARLQPGDFLLGGRNFGYGHPHVQGMRAMRQLGIAAVLADSFFPLYWSGEISSGFPQVACAGVSTWLQVGDRIEVDLEQGYIIRTSDGTQRSFPAYAAGERARLEAGGFLHWLRNDLEASGHG